MENYNAYNVDQTNPRGEIEKLRENPPRLRYPRSIDARLVERINNPFCKLKPV